MARIFQKRTTCICILMSAIVLASTSAQAEVTLTPVDVTRLYAFADSLQSDGAGGYVGAGVYDEAAWNVLTDPLESPGASAADDPIGEPTDGWFLAGQSSFAISHANMTDLGGWSTVNGTDVYEFFVNNQATQDPSGYGPEGWGYKVSYALITYETAWTGGQPSPASMTVTLDIDFSGTVYADQPNDEYLLDVGYALGTGLSDYDPVLDNPAGDPNPGLVQFDKYYSWGSFGFSYEEPAFTDTLVYNGEIGDTVQVLVAMSSFSYSHLGYTWTDGTLDATVTAVPEPGTLSLLASLLALGGLALLRRHRH